MTLKKTIVLATALIAVLAESWGAGIIEGEFEVEDFDKADVWRVVKREIDVAEERAERETIADAPASKRVKRLAAPPQFPGGRRGVVADTSRSEVEREKRLAEPTIAEASASKRVKRLVEPSIADASAPRRVKRLAAPRGGVVQDISRRAEVEREKRLAEPSISDHAIDLASKA